MDSCWCRRDNQFLDDRIIFPVSQVIQLVLELLKVRCILILLVEIKTVC